MRKYRELGHTRMPFVIVFGVHPAYEIMANFSGLHMDMWGELEMVGTIMDQDIEMVPCETLEMRVPAHAEIVVEGYVDLTGMREVGVSVGPSGYYLPKTSKLPELTLTAIHPGITVEHVKASTGWELRVPDDVGFTEPPTADELRLVREELDPEGVYTR